MGRRFQRRGGRAGGGVARWAMRSRLHLALGAYGALAMAMGAWVWWRVASSPGDDNPIGLVAAAAVLLGAVPAWGLVPWARRRGLRAHPMWLACALVAVVPLTGCVAVLLAVLLG